ncbi:hypothetical protein CVT25_012074 [Psilocybe cyanescens]|uniref:Uncharacterized protein n=1 Tax=Psilocybe cyanescens TaxID=93625 RepID=A0A409VMU9_PSICY|nr:hypothetical protein CVT25_012074 [Psilocybe cyanescens]
MLASSETPRPLPPAKMRRASALLKASSTPPPAYGPPFVLGGRGGKRGDILGSPMTSTFQMVGWDADPNDRQLPSPPPENDDWMNEKSREELQELLMKADVIIKERENELGITTAVCKGLYQNNVALKSKHQAMLARIPVSPTQSSSSPESLSRMALCNSNTSMVSSTSDSALGLIKSPKPSFYRRHTRKISIATADISLLEDQNAKLLDKLEKLEAESISADHAGRRELKRLEKEITFLREALEKTQAKSEELEEKVQGAVVGEAWRRKKEREAKFKAMRNLGRDDSESEEPVRNFAPEGSRHGGPSDGFSFFPTAESPNPNRQLNVPSASSDGNTDIMGSSLDQPEHALISQLLIKVQELEQTNVRILQQQSDTAVQLSAVQRDTAHITKVYECLADPNSTELELDHEHEDSLDQEETEDDEGEEETVHRPIEFASLKRSEQSFNGTCIVRPEFGISTGKKRTSVMGLFDEPDAPCPEEASAEGASSSPTQDEPVLQHDGDRASRSSWLDDQDRSTWSSAASTTAAGLASPLPPGALSPLHFFSPASHAPPELSPMSSRPTLQSELDKELGNNWELHGPPNNHHLHMRALSLYDCSQISVPPTPSPLSRTATLALPRRLSIDNEVRPDLDDDPLPCTPLLTSANSLRLSVEPPTPSRPGSLGHSNTGRAVYSLNDTRSPRMQMMSDTLRSRTNRWVDRRFQFQHQYRSYSSDRDDDDDQKTLFTDISRPPSPLDIDIGIPGRLSHAVDSMIDGFNHFTVASASRNGNDDAEADDPDDDGEPTTTASAITPARRRRGHGHGAQESERSVLFPTGMSLEKKEETQNSGFLLQVWLWLQFAIVVFVFLYAMARRGPAKVLTEDHKRAVAHRR